MTIDVAELSDVMQPLDRGLRRKLEAVVEQARDVAEMAAQASLQQLGVGDPSPPAFLTSGDRELRKRLRSHGRQLGDQRDPKTEAQEIERLTEEVAYEHWHRMLFARFLAQNNLLMYPGSSPVAVSLEECDELAVEECAKNGWELASRFAAQMLPQIFRPDSPVFEVVLPPEHEQLLQKLVTDLPVEVFTACDSLGWIYQFWQSRRKQDVNAAEVKIGARELPAVTQLFTEPYMVSFLLDNAVGAWWAIRRLSEADLRNCQSEEELRRKSSIPGVPLTFLRFVRREDGCWIPAAGTFDSWPEELSEFKVMDPCCGSGHFLVAAFLMLVPMRMCLEGISAEQAVERVLLENLHGLEIDQRCVELAAFALALAAWRYPKAGGFRTLPRLNLACSGLAVTVAKEEWKKLALDKHNLRIALDWMHDNFNEAALIGSLLDPTKMEAAKLVGWDDLSAALEKAFDYEQSEDQREAAVVAQGLARSAVLLSKQYNWVITNVPYLARGKQNEVLRKFCETHFELAKTDLATVFLARCLGLCVIGGTTSIVLPQNWLFLTTYRKFREQLLKDETWRFIARLGEGGFESPAAAGAFTILITLTRGKQEHVKSKSSRPFSNEVDRLGLIRGVDVSSYRTASEKARNLLSAEISTVVQERQLNNPDARVSLEEVAEGELLSRFATAYWGQGTGDFVRFGRFHWEISPLGADWDFGQTTIQDTSHYSGRLHVVYWQNGKGELVQLAEELKHRLKNIHYRGAEAWNQNGVSVTQMRDLKVTLYTGQIFDGNCASIIPKDPKNLPAIWCFCSSPEYSQAVRRIDQTLKVTNATLVKVPFDLPRWTKVAKERYPDGLPKPYSEDPTQWIFHGHPVKSEHPLQVAVALLLGYRWPALNSKIDLSVEAQELVRKCEYICEAADEDGIVCIPSVRGEMEAVDRLQNLLARAYGADWSNDSLAELLGLADFGGKSLESWLRDKFFIDHCRLFYDHPFIWQVWDGLRDGFSALINYHKFDRKLLESLIYTYLGDWIGRQKQDANNGIDGAHEKVSAAEALKKRLELILEGEAPYDVFVRWKPIEQQPVGWHPDVNDGVRVNIRPFLTVSDVGKRGAGVLRDRPNVNWNKDRGKDAPSAPWNQLFNGDRINDHHLTLSQKQLARAHKK